MLYRSLEKNPLLRLLHRQTLLNADVILFDSMKTLNLFRKVYGNVAEYHVLYLPIDIDNIPFKPPKLEDKEHIVLASIGGLRYVKRHDPFVMLVEYLHKHEGIDVKGYIIGWGPLESYLSRLIKRRGLEDIIEIKSFKRENLIRFVAENVDVVVSFSGGGGVLSTSVREAMAMGKIVLVRNVGAADEFIVNGVNGFLFNDFWEAVDIMKKLDAKDVRRIAVNARHSIERTFSPEINVKRLVRIYESIDPKALG
jgi:glycosyltransferase involved in cell wall biosynthesis